MKYFILFFLMALIGFNATAQTVDDILIHGKKIPESKKIFLIYEDNTLQYYLGTGNKNDGMTFQNLPSQQYFMPKNNSVSVFIRPVNPLNLAMTKVIQTRVDSIEDAASKAINIIVGQLSDFSKLKMAAGNRPGAGVPADPAELCNAAVEEAKKSLDNIQTLLADNQKVQINQDFSALKKISFKNKSQTQQEIKKAEVLLSKITKHFNSLDSAIKVSRKLVENFPQKCTVATTQFLFTSASNAILKSIESEQSEQVKRLTSLKAAYDLVLQAYNDAAAKIDNNLEWFIKLKPIDITEGTISDLKITVSTSGFELSDKQEIVETKITEIKTWTLSFKYFNHFVPEIAAGFAYANVSYPKYGTAVNNGVTTVANAGSDDISKFSINTMLNLNYYITNSHVNPFFQVGVGSSTDYPAFFMGVGARISTVKLSRLSVSIGTISPWVPSLSSLKVGDVITGTADLEKDLTKTFKFFDKVYFGLQFKL